jgi:hypothetical protein
MARYRTKPFEIEAVQFTGKNLMEIIDFAKTDIRSLTTAVGIDHEVYDYQHQTWIKFSAGDYIIKGMNGEFYPCVADVFEAKYEKLPTVVRTDGNVTWYGDGSMEVKELYNG